MVIGLQIGKLHREGGGIRSPALLDSEKPGLFRESYVHHMMSQILSILIDFIQDCAFSYHFLSSFSNL